MSDNWTQLIKKVSMQERVSSRPCSTVTGKVLSINPIKIGITQQLILDENFILIPVFFSDFEVELDVETKVETNVEVEVETGSAQGTGIGTGIGKARGTFRNSLKTGDEVIMIQQAGGQLYTVIGRVKQ